MPPYAYDDAGAAVLREHYAADFHEYGYEPAPTAGDRGWEQRVAPLLDGLRTTIDEHARIGQLHRAMRRARTRNGGAARSAVLTNVEGHADFDVRWAWADGVAEPGFTAVLRVRNEARSLPVGAAAAAAGRTAGRLVDNGSTDGTVAVARRVAADAGAADRLELRTYPFAVARCGAEHLGTPAESVHSLAHFYNWSFSHVRTAYALKWDGDMVLTDAAVAALRDLEWQLEGTEVVVRVPRHPLYLADDRRAFLDTGRAQLRAVGVAEPARLQLRQGDRLGAAAVVGRRRDDHAGRLVVRRAQAPRRRRVRPLVAQRLRRVGAHAAQAARVGDVPRRRGRRASCPRASSRSWRRTGCHVIDYVRTTWLPDGRARPSPSPADGPSPSARRRRGACGRAAAPSTKRQRDAMAGVHGPQLPQHLVWTEAMPRAAPRAARAPRTGRACGHGPRSPGT